MKNHNKGIIIPIIIIAIAIAVGGGVYYTQTHEKSSSVSTQATTTVASNQDATSTAPIRGKIDPNIFVIGKVFVNTSASGESGLFNADHTITLQSGSDYAGPNTSRPASKKGKWNIEGNVLVISNTSLSNGKYDFTTMSKESVGTKVVFAQWDNREQHAGFLIADDNATIDKILDVEVSGSVDIKI